VLPVSVCHTFHPDAVSQGAGQTSAVLSIDISPGGEEEREERGEREKKGERKRGKEGGGERRKRREEKGRCVRGVSEGKEGD
jgi:hypothetical protein